MAVMRYAALDAKFAAPFSQIELCLAFGLARSCHELPIESLHSRSR